MFFHYIYLFQKEVKKINKMLIKDLEVLSPLAHSSVMPCMIKVDQAPLTNRYFQITPG